MSGVDLIAVLALVGTLAVGEYLAGALIALMLATGRTLERPPSAGPRTTCGRCCEHAPRTARRAGPAGSPVVPLAEVVRGDLLVVGPGEVVAVDGLVEAPASRSWTSRSSPESPRRSERGPTGTGPQRGRSTPAGLRICGPTATAADSTYAGIVRLADEAGAERRRPSGSPTATRPGSCR